MRALDRYRVYGSAGTNPSGMQAEELLREHLGMLHRLATDVLRTAPDAGAVVGEDDLMSVGAVALLACRESFDATRGVSFRVYARIRVRGAMLDELRALDIVPRRTRDAAKLAERTRDALTRSLGRSPSTGELADALGVDEAEVAARAESRSVGRWVELESAAHRLASTQPGPEEIAEFKRARSILAEAIRRQRERDQILLDLYYGKELSMREIAEVLSVSVPRVSQLHAAAVARLKATVEEMLGGAAAGEEGAP